MLEGKLCRLRPIREKDLEELIAIVNNMKVKSTLRNVLPEGEGMWKAKLNRMYSCPYSTDMVFIIEMNGKIVGIVGLSNINWISRNAYLSIAIYDENYHGKGIGKEASELLLSYAFDYLNLDKINLEVYEYNERAIRLYKKLGFVEEGRLRSNNERLGKRHDVIIMGLRRKEYKRG